MFEGVDGPARYVHPSPPPEVTFPGSRARDGNETLGCASTIEGLRTNPKK